MNERSTNDDYLKEAKKLQDKTEASLQNALEMVEATKKVNKETDVCLWTLALCFWYYIKVKSLYSCLK